MSLILQPNVFQYKQDYINHKCKKSKKTRDDLCLKCKETSICSVYKAILYKHNSVLIFKEKREKKGVLYT